MEPTGRAKVNPNYPEGFGQCDRDGFWYNLRDLEWQFEWNGITLFNKRILVCRNCRDVPQEQFRTIILSSDPPPLQNARVPNFHYQEQTPRITQYADQKGPPWAAGPQMIRCDQSGEVARDLQYLSSS